jgi:ABC-type multidrug transport system fused ATPase/permease subunit
LTDTAQEALANQTIVKAYRAEAREQQRFTQVAGDIVRANLRSANFWHRAADDRDDRRRRNRRAALLRQARNSFGAHECRAIFTFIIFLFAATTHA